MNRRTNKSTKKLKGGFLPALLAALAPSLIGPAFTGISRLIDGKNVFTGNGRRKKKKGGAKKSSPWIEHVKNYMNLHNCSYKEALMKAGSTY